MRKILKIGAIANDGTGDKLRNAFDLIQQNFVDMYGFFGDGENITSLSVRQKLEVQTASEIAQEIANAVKPSNDHIESNLNPHNVTKDQVGLRNVDNTADADKNVLHASTTDSLATAINIQGVPFTGATDIELPVFSASTDGLVPKKVGSTKTKFLREDGTWVVPTNTQYALLTKANAEAGTATNANVISAEVLKEAILFHAPTGSGEVTNIAGNAGTATKLATTRQVSFSGAATGSFNFDGSANSSAVLTLANSGVAASTYGSNNKIPVLTVNAKGLITGVTEQAITDGAPNASETTAGKAKIATTAIAKAGVNDTDFITAKKLNSVLDDQAFAGTPNASEEVEGKAKIATTAIAQAGVNDTDIVTAKKLQDVEKFKSGLAVVLDTGVVSRSAGCVASCSKSSTGVYNITLLNPSNLQVFATATSNEIDRPAAVFYNSATSITITTRIAYNSVLRDTPFTVDVELR